MLYGCGNGTMTVTKPIQHFHRTRFTALFLQMRNLIEYSIYINNGVLNYVYLQISSRTYKL